MTSTATAHVWELDRLPGDRAASRQPIDPAPALGGWSNTNRRTWGISRAELVQRDGRIDLHITTADPLGEPHDWGTATVDRLYADAPEPSRVRGYTATFDLSHAQVRIQANIEHGLTVIAALTTFTDGSGRSRYMSREFFHRRAVPATAARVPGGGTSAGSPLAAARGDDRLPMLRASVDPSPLLDTWRNTEEATRGISELRCELRDGQLMVRLIGVGSPDPIDWGEVAATPYADISITGGERDRADPVTGGHPTPHYADLSATDAGPAFTATYDHGFQRVHVQARFNLGVLVVAFYVEFTDGSGRADHFHREVFIRQP